MRLDLTSSHDDSIHQLEDGHPTCLRDLDEANERHFIGGDIAMSNNPVRGRPLDRNALAFLKTAQLPEFIVTFWKNAPPKTVVRDLPHA
jgi:hypothetical protein